VAWQGLNHRLPWSFLAFAMGAITVGAVIFWGIKVHRIRGLMGEVARVEQDLATGQDLWRRFPPLEPRERKSLQEAQERLLRMLPEDKDLPTLLQQVSHLTREYNLSAISLHTDEVSSSAPGSAVAASTATQKAQPAEDSEAISSFPVRLSFAGDYREIAYFLEALQNLPRLVRVDSLKMQRGVPLVVSEVGWQAYYKNGDLLVLGK